MTPLGLVGAAAQVGLAAIFLAAALPKALGLASLRRTLERLGLGEQLAGVAAPALVAVEAIAAISLLVRPGAAWPRALAARQDHPPNPTTSSPPPPCRSPSWPVPVRAARSRPR